MKPRYMEIGGVIYDLEEDSDQGHWYLVGFFGPLILSFLFVLIFG